VGFLGQVQNNLTILTVALLSRKGVEGFFCLLNFCTCTMYIRVYCILYNGFHLYDKIEPSGPEINENSLHNLLATFSYNSKSA
jgi:hypothetical protein